MLGTPFQRSKAEGGGAIAAAAGAQSAEIVRTPSRPHPAQVHPVFSDLVGELSFWSWYLHNV